MTKIRHLIFNALAGAAIVLACSLPVGAQDASEVSHPVILPTPVEEPLDNSAAGELSGLLADTPEVPVTVTREGPPPVKKVSPFPPDGSHIIARRAWLGFDAHSQWYMLHFIGGDEGPALADLRILPSELLSAMEAVLAEHPDPVFEVAGEISVYKDQGYILIASVVLKTDGSNPAEVQPETQSDTQPENSHTGASQPGDSHAGTSHAGASHAGDSHASTEKRPPSASDVLAKLLAEEPSAAIISVELPEARPVQVESVAPVVDSQAVATKTYGMVVWRLVRVIPANDGQWLEVRFEGDNTLAEPPLRVLPSRLLGRAQKWTNAAKGKTVKLRVTGQITQYTGRSYLMLRNVIRQRDMGQF